MNPFPGLRPFMLEENHLFFGREGQTDEVLQKLSNNHFVSIIGPSGSGKSSFVFCGVLPILFGGFLTNTGPNWDVIVLRPGSSPIENLASALLEKDPAYSNEPKEDHEIRVKIISTILRSNSNGLIDAINQIKETTNRNYLILVDQFEELFRYRESAENKYSVDDTYTFINLLTQAVNSEEDAYYVAITMRSDFIGECAQYAELTSQINDSHYLIPQLTRDQKRAAIEGPAAVANGKISQRLIHRLLNDLGDSTDQLPILQHAMMRTWDYWIHNREKEESVDLKHYEAIGTMSEALSQHADEAYNDLNEKQQKICMALFKAITEKRGIYGIRRPTKLNEIAAIAGCPNKELAEVIVTFRKPGRSFLTPMHGIKLNAESVVDISHESLMRIWIRLTNWVDEEAEAVNMYMRLAEAGEMYQIGKAGLWRPPDLQLALNWQVKHKPGLVWGERYDPAFERTLSFLEYSKKEFDNEQKVKELQLKRKQRNQRITMLVLFTATVISIGFLLYALDQKTFADQQLVEANLAKDDADIQRDSADIQKQAAIYQSMVADTARIEADTAANRALRSAIIADMANDTAQVQRTKAEESRLIAIQRQRDAELATARADSANVEAQLSAAEAKKQEGIATERRYLAIAKQLGLKATQNVPDPQLRGLMAKQGFNFNNQYQGNPYDADVYAGLYAALEAFIDPITLGLPGHNKELYAIEASPTDGSIYTGGTKGRILKWTFDEEDVQSEIIISTRESTAEIKDIDISPDGNWLVVAGKFEDKNTTYLEAYNLNNNARSTIGGIRSLSPSVSISADSKTIYYIDNDGMAIGKVDMNGDNQTIIRTSETAIKDLDLTPDGSLIAYVGTNTKLIIINTFGNVIKEVPDGSILESVKYSPDGKYLAYGDEFGNINLFNTSDYSIVKRFTDHTGAIEDIDFNNINGKTTFMASASLDRTTRFFNLERLNDPPITNISPYFVLSVEFTPDNQNVFAGSQRGLLKYYPIHPETMADKMCDYLTRQMDAVEWEAFVGSDIPVENTCTSISSSSK